MAVVRIITALGVSCAYVTYDERRTRYYELSARIELRG
jgi:hypothetical protein